jgi:hypothetical protein
MKGTCWNGDTIATKGTSASEGRGMFSVENLIAFQTHGYCSPDGSHHSSGCNLISAPYLLQDEIQLEEFDRTHTNKYGSGSCDKQEIINLRDRFCHEWEDNWTHPYWLKFLCTVLDDNKPRLPRELCPQPRIEEVRNNPTKFLHIYPVDKPVYEIAESSSSFEEAIEKISDLFNTSKNRIEELEKIAGEKREKLGVKFTEEGIEAKALEAEKASKRDAEEIRQLKEYIDALNNNLAIAMLWKAPYYSRPGNNQIRGDESVKAPYRGEYAGDNVGTVRAEKLLIYRIAKKVKTSVGVYCGSFRASGVVDVFEEDGEITYRLNRYESWCNSQQWHEQPRYDIIRFEIESGEEGSMKEYNDEKKKRATDREEKFKNLSQIVSEKYGEKILSLALQKKGKILATLQALTDFDSDANSAEKALKASSEPNVLRNLFAIISMNMDKQRIRKISEKAFAWAYLQDAIPEISFSGHFDQAMEALNLYVSM